MVVFTLFFLVAHDVFVFMLCFLWRARSLYGCLSLCVNVCVMDQTQSYGSLLFSMDKFLPFLDLFEKDTVKVEVGKAVMQAFVRSQQGTTSDPVILNAMMYIGKVRQPHCIGEGIWDSFKLSVRRFCTILCRR